MGNLINLNPEKDSEGHLLNRYLHSRLIKNNKNVLLCVTGQTGSGKSYVSLKICELWYRYNFKKEFPVKNVCFSVEEVVQLLHSKLLQRGELLILEEGGVNLGSLDFQNKMSKLFTYVLQSFRSMNIGLVINLPVLSMLNKTARLLIHANFITTGIDFEKKVSTIKPFFHQLNQQSGKVYPKYPKIVINKKKITVKRINFHMPDEELIKNYEEYKANFVNDFVRDFVEELDKQKKAQEKKIIRKELSDEDKELLKEAELYTQKEIAKKRGISTSAISQKLKRIKKDIKLYNLGGFDRGISYIKVNPPLVPLLK